MKFEYENIELNSILASAQNKNGKNKASLETIEKINKLTKSYDIYKRKNELNMMDKVIMSINNIVSKISIYDKINYLGFIDDIDSFLASQMLMVAPINIGSGLKMKIPHSLSCV